MPKYLIPCPACGATTPVGIAQAGAAVPCVACGASLDVPGTKQLRSLPIVEEDQVTGRRAGAAGGARDGGNLGYRFLVAAMLVVSALGLGYGGYLAYLRWNAPIEFGHSEEEIYEEIYENSMTDPPARAWDHWNYLLDVGIPDPKPIDYFLINRVYEQQKPWMIGSLAIGGVAFLAFLALSLLGPRPRTQR